VTVTFSNGLPITSWGISHDIIFQMFFNKTGTEILLQLNCLQIFHATTIKTNVQQTDT